MDNEEKPQTKIAQPFASFSLFLICCKTFADLLKTPYKSNASIYDNGAFIFV